jgi:hypothetical protein
MIHGVDSLSYQRQAASAKQPYLLIADTNVYCLRNRIGPDEEPDSMSEENVKNIRIQ